MVRRTQRDAEGASGKGPGCGSGHDPKPYVGDVGEPLETPGEKASAGVGLVAFSLAVGFVVGLVVWAVFWASGALIQLVWGDGYAAAAAALEGAGLASWWLPVAVCGAGGLLIGLWTASLGGAPESLEHVLGTVKKTGGYQLERPGASVVGFLLPLVFGGSVGPEAGLTGLIAAACTNVGRALRAAGLRIKEVADVTVSAALSAVFATPLVGIVATSQDGMPGEGDSARAADPAAYEFRRPVKLLVYTASALGAAAGIAVFTWVFGAENGLPRFDGITPGVNQLWWALPCVVAGYAGALLYRGSDLCFSRVSARVGEHPIAKPTVAGLLLGVLAVPLPYVLFSGETQAHELMGGWQALGAVVLLATGLAKCIATPLCLNFGWHGGHFFPCIFAGIAAGYGMAALLGAEPMFCVAVITATLLAAVQRKPLMVLALLLLCFPPQSLVWMGIACLVGSVLPVPGTKGKGKAAGRDRGL